MAGLFKVTVTTFNALQPANTYLNVFGYKSVLPVSDEVNVLADEFITDVVPAMTAIMSAGAGITRIHVQNVTNGTDEADRPQSSPILGLRTGDTQKGFITWGFRYVRTGAGFRHGYKRIGPISESDTAGEVPTTGMSAVLSASASAFKAPIRVALIDTWFPVILERKPPGVYPWTSHDISNVVFYSITTQNSRKR